MSTESCKDIVNGKRTCYLIVWTSLRFRCEICQSWRFLPCAFQTLIFSLHFSKFPWEHEIITLYMKQKLLDPKPSQLKCNVSRLEVSRTYRVLEVENHHWLLLKIVVIHKAYIFFLPPIRILHPFLDFHILNFFLVKIS